MCGLFGVLQKQDRRSPDPVRLRDSAALLGHRGPDATGVWAGEGIGVAHTRLALVDTDARSNQPFWDASGRYLLIYNGEVYNFRERRAALEARGVEFRTSGDTEVVLQCLIHEPAETALSGLEGMFGLAFWDTVEGELLLARDRFGMKPLYVYEDDQTLLFASEVKAMRPWLHPAVDPWATMSYLLGFGGATRGPTMFRGVKALDPGGVVRYRFGETSARTGRFFSLTDFWDRNELELLRRSQPADVVDRLDQALVGSVERHMFADADVGAFCSGGVDSSLLMAIAARQKRDLVIVHANVKGRWSEHHAAAALSRHLGLELLAVDVHDRDFLDRIPEVVYHYEQPPTYHPNCAPLMLVAELARGAGVKGLLSGEGSDECFLGYPWLGHKRATDTYAALRRGLRTLVRRIPSLGRHLWPFPGEGHLVVRDLGNRMEIEDDRRHVREAASEFGSLLTERDLWTPDYMGHHLRSLLHRNDTMGMAASIEARFPFLDPEVVGLAMNLPARLKLRFSPWVWEKAHPFLRDKWVIRQVADRYLPRRLSQRIKLGFWTTVLERTNVVPGYFDASWVAELLGLTGKQLRDAVAGADQDLTMRLLHLDVWGRLLVEGEGRESVRSRIQTHTTVRSE